MNGERNHLERALGGTLRWDGGDELHLGGAPRGVPLGLVREHPRLLGDVLRASKLVRNWDEELGGIGEGDGGSRRVPRSR